MPNGRLGRVSKEFQDMLDKEDVEKEKDALKDHIIGFIKTLDTETNHSEFLVQDNVLYIIVKSTYLDIFKFKKFHPFYEEERFLNVYKKASTLVKWILKMKPIAVTKLSGSEEDNTITCLVNEKFALYYALKLCNIDYMQSLSSNTSERVIYNFFYRDFNENHFCLWLESLAN